VPSLERRDWNLLTPIGVLRQGYACVYQKQPYPGPSPTTPLRPKAHPAARFSALFGRRRALPSERPELRKNASLLELGDSGFIFPPPEKTRRATANKVSE